MSPPPAAPPAGDGETYATVVRFVIAGSVDDVGDDDKLAYQQFFAAFAGVTLDKVTVDAEAASVAIIVTIYSDTQAAADALKTLVETNLSDPAALEAALAAFGITVTVEQGATVVESSSDSAPVGAIVGGVVGGVVLIAIIVGVIVMKGKGGGKGGTQSV